MPGPIEPSLKYAFTCERVLIEKDGVLSFIRLIDKLTVSITAEEPPDALPPGIAPMTIAMGWVGGLGTHEAAFNIVSPGGEEQPSPQTWSFNLDAVHKVHNIVTEVPVKITKHGVYWIEFTINGAVKGRIPFQVSCQRQQTRR